MKYIVSAFLFLFAYNSNAFAQHGTSSLFVFAEKQNGIMQTGIDSIKKANPSQNLVSPRTLNKDGSLHMVGSGDWCSGFFAAELWLLYQHSHEDKWLHAARYYTDVLEKEKDNGDSHDVGFKIYTSFGNGYKLSHDKHYRDVIIEGAKTLLTRFNPVIGSIKSWDNQKRWGFPVIIDNMMNLELLFEASRLSGDTSFYNIAVRHANTTMKNHYRPNYSSYHVVDYDPETGKVLHKQTAQGFADESAWARGQSWGLYGFTVCYRETKNKVYLDQAENIASFILNNPALPKDLIPYWDYNAAGIPNVPRDASAAAILASALYELSTYTRKGSYYKETADQILSSLNSRYRSKPGQNRGFLLLHSTGHLPAGSEIDVPIIYADYYYLEALTRQDELNRGHKIF